MSGSGQRPVGPAFRRAAPARRCDGQNEEDLERRLLQCGVAAPTGKDRPDLDLL